MKALHLFLYVQRQRGVREGAKRGGGRESILKSNYQLTAFWNRKFAAGAIQSREGKKTQRDAVTLRKSLVTT